MENKDNMRRPRIQIVEIRRVIPKLVKRFIDNYRGKISNPSFNSANSDINLGKLRRRLDYWA